MTRAEPVPADEAAPEPSPTQQAVNALLQALGMKTTGTAAVYVTGWGSEPGSGMVSYALNG